MAFIRTTGQQMTPHKPLEQGHFQINQKAVLFIYAPRAIFDQSLRAHSYSIDANLTYEASRAVDMIARNGSRNGINSLLGTNAALTATMPSNQGSFIKTSSFSDRWTFTLVIDDATDFGSGDVFTAGHPGSDRRLKYSGYFSDEPCSMLIRGSKPTLNHNALMIFTERDMAHRSTGYGHHGAISTITGVASDMIIPQNDIIALTGTRDLMINTPSTLFDSIDIAAGPQLDMLGDTAGLATVNAPPVIPYKLANPTECFRQLTHAAAAGYEAMRVTSSAAHHGYGSLITADDTLTTAIAQNLRVDSGFAASNTAAINVAIPHRLGEIIQRFHPHIHPIKEEGSLLYTPADQTPYSGLQGRLNQVSALIANTMTAKIADAGFTSLTFDYDSTIDRLGQHDMTGAGFVFHSWDTIYPMNQEEVANKIRCIQTDLRNTTFRAILAAHGNFVVSVQAATGHYTTVQVNLYDHQQTGFDNIAPFEIPTILGGMNTNQVASHHQAAQNAGQIEGFIRTMTGIDQADYFGNSPQVGNYQEAINRAFNNMDSRPAGGNLIRPAGGFITNTAVSPEPTAADTMDAYTTIFGNS